MITALEILSVFALVAANGFFVASEFALVSVRRSRVQMLADAGNRAARRVLHLKDNLNAYISATQFGITLASLGLGVVGEPALAGVIERALGSVLTKSWQHAIITGISFAAITFFTIVLGELLPKTVALQRTEKLALLIALPIDLFYRVFVLPIRVLYWTGMRVAGLFGLEASNEHGSTYTEEELRQIVDLSHQSGHIEEEEQRLINRIFDFAEAEIGTAMIPRTEVVALPVTATIEEAEEMFCTSGYSRLPVYREQLDDIVGVLFMKELLPCLRRTSPQEFNIEQLAHPPLFIPATARLGAALAQMQSARTHLAFVVDEHGGVEGIVTLEDLLEEIVGEINDEYDEEAREQVIEENGSYVLDGMLPVRDANRELNLKLPEDASYTTLAGFLLDRAGRLLKPGETIDYDSVRFTVESVDRHRIRRVRLTPAATNGNGKREENESAAD